MANHELPTPKPNLEKMLERIVVAGLEAENQGAFAGKTGTHLEDGFLVYDHADYKIYREATQELARIWASQVETVKKA